MGEAAFGQVAVLGMKDHRQVEGGGVFQGAAQVAVAGELGEPVAESDAAGLAQGDQLGQLFSGQVAGQRTDREDLGMAGFAGAVEDQLGHRGGVQHRTRLRWAAQTGDAAGCRSQGFTGDRALAAVARLAQGDREIDEPGRGDQALRIDCLLSLEAGRSLANGRDPAILQEDIGDFVAPAVGVDNARAEDSCCHHHCCSSDTDSESIWRCAVWPLIAMDSTAMRMAMP